MKNLIGRMMAALALVTAVACGSDSTTAPQVQAPDPSYVVWRVDAQSCTGSAAIDLFVDGSRVGTQVLAAGSSSSPYNVAAGMHVLGASVSNNAGFVWPSQTLNVPAGSTLAVVLKC